jgi:hypothetical protein
VRTLAGGAPGGTRTHDHQLKRLLLYRLSYGRPGSLGISLGPLPRRLHSEPEPGGNGAPLLDVGVLPIRAGRDDPDLAANELGEAIDVAARF